MAPASTTAPSAWPALYQGWVAVGALSVAYAVSYIDRQIINLLVEPIKQELAIGDFQIGLLQGIAFGLFYTFLGLPLGWLADRIHRVRLIAGGIILWSAMTILCGLSPSFPFLFLSRMGVGIGEATLVPAAISLLADMFRPDRRAMPMSMFTTGVAIGSGLALILGGQFIGFSGGGVRVVLVIGPLLSEMSSWRVAFILAGIIGIPIAGLILLLPEPHRHVERTTTNDADPESALGFLILHRSLFLPMLLGVGLLYILTYAVLSWMPSVFVRQFNWTPAAVGQKLGLVILVCSLCGNIASGMLATWLVSRGFVDAPLRAMIIGAYFLVPAAILGPIANSELLALMGAVTIFFSAPLAFGVATAAFTTVTPNQYRGRIVALYLFAGSLLGLGLGPTSVGFLLDNLFGDPQKVGSAIAIISIMVGPVGIWLLTRALGPYRGAAQELSTSL
jgi:MFS family permease